MRIHLTRLIVAHLGKPASINGPMLASGMGWLIFSIYWEIAGKNAAPAVKSESKLSRRVHLVLANAALLLIFLPIRGLQQRYLPHSPIVVVTGLTLETAGLLLAVWARRHLGRNWSGEITIKVNHALIRTGPYRSIRHPIYTAVLAMYAGTAVVSGEMHAVLGMALVAIAYWRKVRLEEANLIRAFGEDYQSYRRDTWAVLPGLY